jgi:APA family basic amino acid/polyamine antiporter
LAEGKTQDKLERKLGLFPLTNIVVANMIGAGIFTTSGLLMTDLYNPALMLVLWLVGGVIALCGALSYGELGASIPEAGGEYIFLSKLYSPGVGFLSGWVSFIVGFSAAIAASAIGFSEYLVRAFPGIIEWTSARGFLEPEILKKLISVLIILLFTFIHLRGIEFGARVQNYLSMLKVGLIAVLIIAGFLFGKGDFNNLTMGTEYTFDFGGWQTIGLSLMWIMFAYSGWNASTYIGSEIRDPQKNLPRSLLLGTGIVIVLYLFINLFFVYAVTPENMKDVISIGGLAAGNAFGESVETVISLLISFALFSSLSAFIILGPRVYYSMAKDGYFFKFVSEVHPSFKVPFKAIMLQALISMIMILSGTFDQILTYMGFSLGIFPLLAIAGVFKLRIMDRSKLKMPGYPYVQIVYLLTGLTILTLSYFERPVESSIAMATVITGIPVFIYFKKKYKIVISD